MLILLFSSIGGLLYRRTRWPNPKRALISIVSVGFLYLAWDHLVTGKWWWFNPDFVLGIHVGNLPLEEVLFFLTVPWSCLIIWENLKNKLVGRLSFNIEKLLILTTSLLVVLAIWFGRWYSFAAAILMILVSVTSLRYGQWLRKRSVLLFLLVVFVLTMIFNGYLTARPVVIYNSSYISGLRIASVPIEDIFYGLSLLCLVVMVYENIKIKNKDIKKYL